MTSEAALALVFDGQGRILTISRKEPPHEQAIPGGSIDEGESPAAAARRELYEECGVVVDGLALVHVLTAPDGRRVHVHRAGSWSSRPFSAEPPTRVRWLTPAELLAQAVRFRASVEELMAEGHLTDRTVTMDLAPGDVHHAGGGASKAPRKPRRKRVFAKATAAGPGAGAPVPPKSPKQIRVAKQGRFLGHPSGPFEMNEQTFEEIVRNFKASPEELPIDFEHASEADATDGSIPQAGAPAQGWIKDMRIEGGNLFGLVEWGSLAREYIREGKYKYFSPAIRFGAKDRVTGKPIGARMTSGALTNSPFLAGLQRLVAKDVAMGAGKVAEGPTERGNELVHKPSEYMPQIRMCMGLHPLASAKECADHLDRLRDHVEACGDAMGTHEGVDLSTYTKPLRDLVDAAPGTTWDEVFDTVEDLIHAAIGEHVVEDHGGRAEMAEADPHAPVHLDDDTEGADMTDKNLALALKDTQTKAGELEVKLKDTTTQLADVTTKLSAAEAELVTLRAERADRIKADIQKDVADAIDTYPTKLSDKDTESLIAMATAAPGAFRKLYPFVPPKERHLLRNVTPPEMRPRADDLDANGNPLTINGQIKKVMVDRKMSWDDAANEVAKMRNPSLGKPR